MISSSWNLHRKRADFAGMVRELLEKQTLVGSAGLEPATSCL